MREAYGERIECSKPDMFSFPSVSAMLEKATDGELRKLGFGYRAPYIIKSTSMISEKGAEDYLLSLRSKDIETCRKELT